MIIICKKMCKDITVFCFRLNNLGLTKRGCVISSILFFKYSRKVAGSIPDGVIAIFH